MKLSDSHRLEEAKQQALVLMKEAGFAVQDVSVTLDPDLPYMGYTTEREGKPVIVVSGMALSSGAAINLLIHEMSHVYRSQSRHPSHDYQLLTSIAGWVIQGRVVNPYQDKIIHTILNHLQDLYADDISFKIFNTSQQDLSGFFLGWIHQPVAVKSEEDRWTNADYLLSAAFAQANLERHNVADKGGKVAKAIKEFLAKLEKTQAEKYTFFKDFMVRLPEKATQKEFEKLLIKYLSEFLKLTKI